MKLATLGMKDKEHVHEVHEEAGLDPLPVLDGGPLDPLYKLWSLGVGFPIGFGLMAAAVFGSALVAPIVPFEKMQTRWPQPLMKAAGQVASYGKIKVVRHHELDETRPSMFCMNHTSMLDAHAACASIPQPFCGMQHAHHFNIPVYGWLMKIGNGIGVQKGANGQFDGVKEQFLDRAERGISVLVFPEGRRTQNGRILPYKRGVFLMARDAEMPVCTLAVRGLWGTLRRNEWVLRPNDVTAYVGPQIETKGLSDAQLDELALRMQHFTADFVERGVLGDPRSIDPRRARS